MPSSSTALPMLQAEPAAILLFVIGFITTFVFAFAWLGKRTEKATWLEGFFLSGMSVVAYAGWLGVLLAGFGRFHLGTLAFLLLLTGVGMAWWQRPFSLPRLSRPGWEEGIVCFLLLAAGLVYFQPHEYIMGGADAGGYINIAATLARSGEFIVHDEWASLLREHADVALRRQPPQQKPEYLQFVGWYFDDDDPARVIPQFFPFHPVLLAIGMSLFGIWGGYGLASLWGTLSLLSVYLLTRRLFGTMTALLAMVLLGITATHIFFARYPTTETLTLLLLFTGLLFFQQIWEDENGSPVMGLFGGLVLGVALLTRIDLPLIALLLFAACGWRYVQGKWSRTWTVFAGTFSVLLGHAVLSALLLNWPYTWNTYSSVLQLLNYDGLLLLVAAVAALTMLALFFVWRAGRWGQMVDLGRQILTSSTLRRTVAAVLVLLSAYAYFLRPVLEPVQVYNTWPSGNEVPLLDGQNWLRLGWYLTPLGLLLATLGAAWLVATVSWERYGLFLAVGLTTTVQYAYRMFNTPYHIYTMRRYVPVVIPMLMIYTAVLLTHAVRRRRRPWQAVAGGVALTLAVGLLYQSRYVLPQRDLRGAVAQLTALNAQIKPGAILLINEPPTQDFADRVGVPLRFIFGHDVATIRSDDAEAVQAFLAELQAYAAARQRPLQLLAVEPVSPAVRNQLPLQPVTMFPIDLQMLMNTFDTYPSVVQTLYYGVEIYDVVDPSRSAQPEEIFIDVGTQDAIYLQSGFYYKEPLPNMASMRWTEADARLSVAPIDTESVIVTVRAMIFRPEIVPPAVVTVTLDGEQIGQFTPDSSWQTYTFAGELDPVEGRSILRFQTATFNPQALGVNNDTRDLGFLIDWVTIASD